MSFRKFLVFAGLSLFLSKSFLIAQPQLTEEATISMVIIGPYDQELWSSWGHAAIRVNDPKLNIDWVYDFGRFSFNQENFYWNYALGKTYYSIGLNKNYLRLRNRYIAQDRSLHELEINLSQQEVQKVFLLLEKNNEPENREYLYNYVYDNCATRLVDIIDKVIDDEVIYDESFVQNEKSIRGLMDEGLAYQPWGDLLIDLFLGLQIDKVANAREYMMMPRYLEDALSEAYIERGSSRVPLVREKLIIHEQEGEAPQNGIFTPFNVFVLVFFVVGFITNKNFKTMKRTKWIDYLLFSLVGILGSVCSFLWFGTEHLSKYNYNLLWAIPFHLPAIWLLTVKKWQPFLVRYFRFTAVLYSLLLVFWALLPQGLHQSLIPLILTLVLRSFYISYDLGRNEIKKAKV